jgi:hypothetical protein
LARSEGGVTTDAGARSHTQFHESLLTYESGRAEVECDGEHTGLDRHVAEVGGARDSHCVRGRVEQTDLQVEQAAGRLAGLFQLALISESGAK